MTRIHDMGGRFGDGPVQPDANEPVFKEEWHARALAVTLAAGALGQWNIDVSRHARERLPAADYARFTYYEKWISALANLLVETGILNPADIAGEGGKEVHPLADRAMQAESVPSVMARGGPADRPSDVEPIFQIGQRVRTRRPSANLLVDGGHTRLPAYAAGVEGTVLLAHGAHVLPDSSAHGLGEAPEPLYTVVFMATDLWANAENPKDEVTLDLWQSYLEPV
ncbi:MAG: nitrile hydratase subunit beta [Arenibacterium sp.]